MTNGRMLFAGALIAATIASSFGASAAGDTPRQERTKLKLIATNGWSVDNDPAGESGGDLFGSSGVLHKGGEKIGKFSSACTLSPPVGGQCQATLIWKGRGRIQIAGNITLSGDTTNIVSIVGGTRDFRRAGGVARLEAQNGGAVQRVRLHILYR
jgi:hypothetical protein